MIKEHKFSRLPFTKKNRQRDRDRERYGPCWISPRQDSTAPVTDIMPSRFVPETKSITLLREL
jgi:hypothetical protein